MGNNSIDTRSLWLFGHKGTILENKQALIDSYIKDMMSRTIRMFEWENLPDTIPERELELLLQLCRFVIVTKAPTKEGKDELFVFYGGLGGMPNEYYQPTQAIVANPYLRFSKVLNLDDYIREDGDAVLGWNDSMHEGLYPLNSRYAGLLAETDLTLKYQLINMRFLNVFTAKDDTTKESIKKMFEDVSSGTGFGIVVTKNFMGDSDVGSIDVKANAHQAQLKDTVETKQYLWGSWFNELGLNANYNMKREAINESEADLNEDSLLPRIDDMLRCRELLRDAMNAKFKDILTKGAVNVRLSSSWEKIRKEIKLREEQQKAEAEQAKAPQADPEPKEPTESEEGKTDEKTGE